MKSYRYSQIKYTQSTLIIIRTSSVWVLEWLTKIQLNNFREASGHEEFNERYKKSQTKQKNKNVQSLIEDILHDSNEVNPDKFKENNDAKEYFNTEVEQSHYDNQRRPNHRFSATEVYNSIQASTDLRVSVDPDLAISRRTNNFMLHDENTWNQMTMQSSGYSPISKFITYSK